MVKSDASPHIGDLLLNSLRHILAALLRQTVDDPRLIPTRSNDLCDVLDDLCVLLAHLVAEVGAIEALGVQEGVAHADGLDAVLHDTLIRCGREGYNTCQITTLRNNVNRIIPMMGTLGKSFLSPLKAR